MFHLNPKSKSFFFESSARMCALFAFETPDDECKIETDNSIPKQIQHTGVGNVGTHP